MKRTLGRIFLPLLLLFGAGICSPALAKSTLRGAEDYRRFEGACLKAFEPENQAFGKRICECTSGESRHQGVPVSVLRKETARIKADPKYKIQDKRLLASLQYCSIEEMKKASQE